jgi:hypothetical protein
MAIPGFTADSSLLLSVRARSMIGVSAASGDAGKVVPQQWLECTQACQQSWSDCLNSCSWWEWVTGACVPKCGGEGALCQYRCGLLPPG